MNYESIGCFLIALMITYIFFRCGDLLIDKCRRRLVRRGRPAAQPGQRLNAEFKVILDKPPAGLIDLTKDQYFEITIQWNLPAPGDDINTDDFQIPEYLEEREQSK